MSMFRKISGAFLVMCATTTMASIPASGQQQGQKPNILVIMGDDIGMWNIGAYHRGLMAGRTPNLDKIAKEGMLSLTTTLRRAARRAARTSSWANYQSAPA